MVSYANTITSSGKVLSATIALAETNDLVETDAASLIYQLGESLNNVVINNVKVNFDVAKSCTVWANVTIGFGDSAVVVGVSASGSNCAMAIEMLRQELESMGL